MEPGTRGEGGQRRKLQETAQWMNYHTSAAGTQEGKAEQQRRKEEIIGTLRRTTLGLGYEIF